jgi:hypothetical protein
MATLALPGGLKIFTRKLTSEDEHVDFATEIKISAKTKLRRTNQQRSPGGTPMRLECLSPDQNSFKKALLSKFKNTRGGPVERSGASAKAASASAGGDAKKRTSLGKRLDAERDRTQSEVTDGEWEDGDKENVSA